MSIKVVLFDLDGTLADTLESVQYCSNYAIGTCGFPEIPLDKHLDLMRKSIEELLIEAEKCDIIVCIENSMSRAACPKSIINERPNLSAR